MWTCGTIENLMSNRLNYCELCGTRFTDDNHKDRHPDSCPKLPAFHKIGSLKSEPFGKDDRHALCNCQPMLTLVVGLLQILSRLRFRW